MPFIKPTKLFITFISLSIATYAQAGPATPDIEKEIHQLMERLSKADCTFIRNDTPYPAAKAREHILKKYDYVKDKTTVKSTEEFIELTATKSSMSNKPYQVKCGTTSSTSQAWLQNELKKIRKGK